MDLKILVIGPKDSGKTTIGEIVKNDLDSYSRPYQASKSMEYFCHQRTLGEEQVSIHMYIIPADHYPIGDTNYFYDKQYDAVFCVMDLSDQSFLEKNHTTHQRRQICL